MTDLSALARTAARNNAEWCAIICRTHDAPGVFHDAAWATVHATPPFYPNMVTLDPALHDQQLAIIDDLIVGLGHHDEIGVKDSFAALDLTSRGFGSIIEGQWIVRTRHEALPDIGIESVANEDTLVEWGLAWNMTSPARTAMFLPELLDHNDLLFLAEREGHQITAGLIANRSAGAVGISNFFASSTGARAFLSRALAAVSEHFPQLPIVGYASGPELGVMFSIGFEAVGPLRVWVRPPNAAPVDNL